MKIITITTIIAASYSDDDNDNVSKEIAQR
jgi:hypothetical protein